MRLFADSEKLNLSIHAVSHRVELCLTHRALHRLNLITCCILTAIDADIDIPVSKLHHLGYYGL